MIKLEELLEAILTNECNDADLAHYIIQIGFKTGTEVKQLLDVLKYNTSIKHLSIAEEQHLDGFGISEMIKQNKGIVALDLSDNKLNHNTILSIFKALLDNTSITKLNLRGNFLLSNVAHECADLLNQNQSLIELTLGNNGIGIMGGVAFSTHLKANFRITYLDLSSNHLGPEGSTAILEALKENTNLLTLILADNGMCSIGGKALALFLEKNKTLTTLNISNNSIGIDNGKSMAQALKTNKSLTALHAVGNRLFAEGGIALASALKENRSLTYLDIQFNRLEAEGAYAFFEPLEMMRSIKFLYLYNNDMLMQQNKILAKIQVLLKRNSTLYKKQERMEIATGLLLKQAGDDHYCLSTNSLLLPSLVNLIFYFVGCNEAPYIEQPGTQAFNPLLQFKQTSKPLFKTLSNLSDDSNITDFTTEDTYIADCSDFGPGKASRHAKI